jgi:hypothetical protein
MRGNLEVGLPKAFGELGRTHRSRFRIGGVSVEVAGERSADVALVPSLVPFRVAAGVPDIHIQVEWTDSLPPTAGRRLFDSGTTWRVYEDGAGFQFDFNAPVFGERPYKRLLVDQHFRQATLHMSDESFVSFPHVAQPLEYPLDELLIMHRLTQENAIELHSCGIARPDGTGNLFVGHSGAGKSTTARLWSEHEEVEVLSDDRIIVRREAEPAETTVETPFGAAGCADERGVPFDRLRAGYRLRDCSASRGIHFAQDDRGRTDGEIVMYGTPWHGEAAFASPGNAPLSRIFILEHGRGNVLTRLSPGQAVAELFARSFVPFHRHEFVESALEFLQDVAGTLPCYRYAFEPDQGAVERILSFHE